MTAGISSSVKLDNAAVFYINSIFLLRLPQQGRPQQWQAPKSLVSVNIPSSEHIWDHLAGQEWSFHLDTLPESSPFSIPERRQQRKRHCSISITDFYYFTTECYKVCEYECIEINTFNFISIAWCFIHRSLHQPFLCCIHLHAASTLFSQNNYTLSLGSFIEVGSQNQTVNLLLSMSITTLYHD